MDTRLDIVRLREWGIRYNGLFIIAGPCSAESPKQLTDTAIGISKLPVSVMRAGIWKPRTRPGSFEGVGSKGLPWLKEAGQRAGLPVAVEVAQPVHVEKCLRQGIDILWIGSRTTANPFAVQEISSALSGADIPLFVKNPICPDLGLWIGALERINRAGITRLAAIHRGFCISDERIYRNRPEWWIPIELRRCIPNLPLLCDPSHICGKVKLLPGVIRKAMDLLMDGLMIECHANPSAALSDAAQQVTPEELGALLSQLDIKQASTDDPEYLNDISYHRSIIDVVDEQIMELLAQRMKISTEIGRLKKRKNISILQPERLRKMLADRVESSRAKGLSESFLLQLFRRIHEESIRHQESAGANDQTQLSWRRDPEEYS